MEVKEKKTPLKKVKWLVVTENDLDYLIAIIEENIVNSCENGSVFQNGNLKELQGRMVLFTYLEHVREGKDSEQ